MIVGADTDWRNVFLDSSVLIPDAFRDQMGGLCQQGDLDAPPLSDADFFGRWRGWLESAPDGARPFPFSALGWPGIAPPGWRDVAAIPPPEGCRWKTGPLPPAE